MHSLENASMMIVVRNMIYNWKCTKTFGNRALLVKVRYKGRVTMRKCLKVLTKREHYLAKSSLAN